MDAPRYQPFSAGLYPHRHRQAGPGAVAVLGAGLIAYVMFANHDPLLEGLGFAVLLGAVILDLYQFRRAEMR